MNAEQLKIVKTLKGNSLKQILALADHYGFDSRWRVNRYETMFKVTIVPTLDDHIDAKHYARADAVSHLATKLIELESND